MSHSSINNTTTTRCSFLLQQTPSSGGWKERTTCFYLRIHVALTECTTHFVELRRPFLINLQVSRMVQRKCFVQPTSHLCDRCSWFQIRTKMGIRDRRFPPSLRLANSHCSFLRSIEFQLKFFLDDAGAINHKYAAFVSRVYVSLSCGGHNVLA